MDNECAFSELHPLTLLLWFAVTLVITVLSLNPILTVISFVGAAAFRATAGESVPTVKEIVGILLFMLAMSVLNPVFSHHGVTVMFFLHDLPVTKESFFFGVFMSFTAAAAILWCGALTFCMKSDKIIFLFGRIFPRVAVLISLTLRFIPMYKQKYRQILDAAKGTGLYGESTLLRRVRSSLDVFSALVTMILEDSIDTSDSMRARGIGLRGRSFYSDHRFHLRDIPVFLTTALSELIFIFAHSNGHTLYSFYPAMTALPTSFYAVLSYAAFGILSAVPTITEVISWKRSSLKM